MLLCTVFAPSWLLLPLTCRSTFLFPAFFAQGPLFRPTPSGVLWPKQTFLSQQHKKYHYSTSNASRGRELELWTGKTKFCFPNISLNTLMVGMVLAGKIQILNFETFGVQIWPKSFRFLFESFTYVPICLLKVIN